MKQTTIFKQLLTLSLPVMLALLIQSIYNIVDSYFVARYSSEGLTALSIVFPIQLLMNAIATGTGTGINILVSRMSGAGDTNKQDNTMKSGLFLGLINFLLFAFLGLFCMKTYFEFSTNQPLVREMGMQYCTVLFIFSGGMFLEANCTKLLQAKGNMLLPMFAQIIGAIVNLVLDPLLIFGLFGFPSLGIQGAAIATVVGQWCAMLIVLIPVLRHLTKKGQIKRSCCLAILQSGLPAIIMQSLYTLYMIGLNLILKRFSEDAVTVLGIYYKLQTFFFIPLLGLSQVILPIISFHYGAKQQNKVSQTLRCTIIVSVILMVIGSAAFWLIPSQLLSIFATKQEIITIGVTALRLISLSFVPAAFVIMLTVYFQGVNKGNTSISITILRQIILLVPLAWLFHFKGLTFVWLTFPVTEVIALLFSMWLYRRNERVNAPSLRAEPL